MRGIPCVSWQPKKMSVDKQSSDRIRLGIAHYTLCLSSSLPVGRSRMLAREDVPQPAPVQCREQQFRQLSRREWAQVSLKEPSFQYSSSERTDAESMGTVDAIVMWKSCKSTNPATNLVAQDKGHIALPTLLVTSCFSTCDYL